jgi:hypothetical protein
MGETETPVGSAHPHDLVVVDQGAAAELYASPDDGRTPRRRRRIGSFVAGGILSLFSLVLLAAGGWTLWKDRVDRDADGFVSIGTTDLRTETYAIVGDLRGAGPDWLWGSTVMGDERVRATSLSGQPLFIGVARSDDVLNYLKGVGFARIDRFEVTADTTHAGGAPSGPPAGESIWAASTQAAGPQTLVWTPRSGDWSIVFMNADAGAGVAVHGDGSAEFPILPWVAVGLLLAGGALGVVGGWVLVRATRRVNERTPEPDASQPSTAARDLVPAPSWPPISSRDEEAAVGTRGGGERSDAAGEIDQSRSP